MRIMFALTLALLCVAGVTHAQDLQNTLIQPAAGDSIVPDVVSNIHSQPEDPTFAEVMTSMVTQEIRAPQDTSGVIHAQMENQAHNWVAPPLRIEPTENLAALMVPKENPYSYPYPYSGTGVVPEPGSLLALALGLGGLVSWGFRSRSR